MRGIDAKRRSRAGERTENRSVGIDRRVHGENMPYALPRARLVESAAVRKEKFHCLTAAVAAEIYRIVNVIEFGFERQCARMPGMCARAAICRSGSFAFAAVVPLRNASVTAYDVRCDRIGRIDPQKRFVRYRFGDRASLRGHAFTVANQGDCAFLDGDASAPRLKQHGIVQSPCAEAGFCKRTLAGNKHLAVFHFVFTLVDIFNRKHESRRQQISCECGNTECGYGKRICETVRRMLHCFTSLDFVVTIRNEYGGSDSGSSI